MSVKIPAPVGDGVGIQKFSIRPGGMGLQMESSVPAPTPGAPPALDAAPAITPPTPPPTPFQRLFPGVDPASVEINLDDKSGKIRFKPIEAPPEVPTPPAETPNPAPPAPSLAAPGDPLAELRAQIEQRDQLMAAMVQASITGRPLAEILSGAPAVAAEPDYSNLDLYDDAQRTQFIKQLRADTLAQARAEVQAQMAGHLPAIQNAGRAGERAAISAKYGADPNYQQKAQLTEKLIGNNPNISFEATFNLVSQIQDALNPSPSPTKPPAPVQNANPTLTPAQAEAKAAQAARYPAPQGGRANGAPTPPPEVAKNFKKLAAWVAHQQALGNLP